MAGSKGGRPCRVCHHPRRGEVDAALREGTKVPTLAERFGIPETNLRRHAKSHLEAAEAPAEGAPETIDAEPSKVVRLLVLKALRVAREAEAAGNAGAALRALRVVGDQLAAVARMKAAEPPPFDPLRDEVLGAFRDRLARVLEDFPEAKAAVLASFRDLAEGAG